MAEVAADTRYGPKDLPADAVLICTWGADHPPKWEVVGVISGVTTLEDALTQAGQQFPSLSGRQVLATKIGAKSGTIVTIKRSEKTTVSVSLG